MKRLIAVCFFAAVAWASLDRRPVSSAWILKYQCENLNDEIRDSVCMLEEDTALKSFKSKELAIAWAETNYTFFPLSLQHGDKIVPCLSVYIDTDDPDPITIFRKVVTCDGKHLR